MDLPCLSVRAPWAQLIASGRKIVELRTWPAPVRGRIAIQQSLRTDASSHEVSPGKPGHVIATVEVVDCYVATEADADCACVTVDELRAYQASSPRPVYAWLLDAPELLARPVAVKGACGRLSTVML